MSDDFYKPWGSDSPKEWSHFDRPDTYGAGNSKSSNWTYSSSVFDSSKKDQSPYSWGASDKTKTEPSWAYSTAGNGTFSASGQANNSNSWAFQSGDQKKDSSPGLYSRVSDSFGMGAENHLNYLKDEQRSSSLRGWENADRSWNFENVSGALERNARIENIESSLYATRYSGFHSSTSWAYGSNAAIEPSWAFATSSSSTSSKSESSWAFSTEPATPATTTTTTASADNSWNWSPVGDPASNKLRRW